MKLFIFLLTFSSYAFSAQITLIIKGMVCEFCVTTLEKEFRKESAIESLTISLDDSAIYIKTYPRQDITDDKLTEIVINNGYNIDKIIR